MKAGIAIVFLLVVGAASAWWFVSPRPPVTSRKGRSAPDYSQLEWHIKLPESLYKTNAAKLALLYTLAGAHPDQVPPFIRGNREHFADTRQLSAMADRLTQKAFHRVAKLPTRDQVREHAWGLAGANLDLQGIANGISDKTHSDLYQMIRMGQLMNSLVDCIPSILRGDDRKYHQSEMYQMKIIFDQLGADELLTQEMRIYIFAVTYPLVNALMLQAAG